MSKNKKILIALSLAIIIGGGVFAYSQISDKEYPQNTSGEYVTDEAEKSNENAKTDEEDSQSVTSDNNTEPPKPNKTSNNQSTSSSLYKPTGNFVSAHRVNPSSTIESVCVTTPGAKCKIVFTRGTTVKSLVSKTTDGEGTTAWIWQPKKIGITGGSWQIKAVATLNGQKKVSKDAMSLEVGS